MPLCMPKFVFVHRTSAANTLYIPVWQQPLANLNIFYSHANAWEQVYVNGLHNLVPMASALRLLQQAIQ